MDDYTTYAESEYGALTDIGNALRLASRFENDLRYSPSHGWLRYEGHRMVQLAGLPLDEGMGLPDLIRAEGDAYCTEKRLNDLEGWAKKSSSEARIASALRLAADLPVIRTTAEQLDRFPLELNTPQGVFHLGDGTVRETLASDLLTRSTRATPAPGCPTWDKFLTEVLPSQDVRNFLQRAIGYSITGLTREEVFFVLYGAGQNGKSKLLSAVARALGNYAHAFDPKLVLQQRYEGHPTNIASLHGVRFAYSSEIDAGSQLDEGRVKAITGGDVITARFMRKDEFSWVPTHKLWLATNHLPVIKGQDKGMWRRVVVIPFDVPITDDQRDNLLEEKLWGEMRGILAWAIDGAVEYMRYGLQPPVEVLMASAHYKQEQDTTSLFINECTSPGGVTAAGELYSAYKRWAEDNGNTVLNNTAFGRELTRLGYESALGTGGKRLRNGITLTERSWV